MEREIISRYFVQGYRLKKNAIVYYALLLDCECYKDKEQ